MNTGHPSKNCRSNNRAVFSANFHFRQFAIFHGVTSRYSIMDIVFSLGFQTRIVTIHIVTSKNQSTHYT